MSEKISFSEEQLRNVVPHCSSFKEVSVALGYTKGNNKVRKAILDLNIDTSHFNLRSRVARDKNDSKELIIERLYNKFKADANHHVDLTIEQFSYLIFNICHYCHKPPIKRIYKYSRDRKHGILPRHGIDRIDSNHIYTEGNCVTCCVKCNRSKSDMTYEEFREHVKAMYENFVVDKINDGLVAC